MNENIEVVPVTVSLIELKNSSVTFQTLEQAFGPSSLGILIVKDLPGNFLSLRHRLLSYASYLAHLPPTELDALTSPSSNYLKGWSHGKETLKTGIHDTLKGSFYVNCNFNQRSTSQKNIPASDSSKFPGYAGPNIWPRESLLPGFRQTFEELCTLVIDVAVLVARALDQYAVANIEGYEPGYLEKVVQTSTTTKGRLLHYFPSRNFSTHSSLTGDSQPVSQDTLHLASPTTSNENNDSWCATHLDHGCLTGLTSALYIDESAHPPHLPSSSPTMSFLPPIPCLSDPPSEKLGLYIHSRASSITKVAIPSDCLAFQTGEALELITGGKFRAVPHFVCAGDENDGRNIARNTLAVFTQPELGEIVRKENGTTFGDFCQEVSQRFQ